ncbi:MAG: ChaN family lipoprotein [Gammaproteobacteria bacterium]|nr:MAG: ChaN family lipoprotein [Gammaproteobacteria bacterium]
MNRIPSSLTRAIRGSGILLFAILLNACAGKQATPGPVKNADDPLIDSIYRATDLAQVSEVELYDNMAASDVIYLGENHDNIHHHRIQLNTIEALVERGLKPAIGFEFFSREQTSRLLQFQQSPDKFHAEGAKHSAEHLLRDQLGWGDSRDADWDHLFPILKFSREHKLPVFGADLNSGLRKQLARHGYDGLNGVEKLLMPRTEFKDDTYREYMFQSFTVAHCGWRDDGYLENLYETWLLRNEAMAQSIVAMHTVTPDQPVVIILGGAHTEYNMAVYERVANLNSELKQINLRLTSVAESPIQVHDYFQPLQIDGKSYGPPYQYIWFTARMPEREDPCKAFLKHKNKRAKHGQIQ